MELSLDELADRIDNISLVAKKLEEEHEAREEEKEEHKAAEEEHEEKMRKARHERDEKMLEAMSEEDDEKRDEKMRKAMKEYDDKDDKHEAARSHRPKELHAEDEEKEEKEHIASMIQNEKMNLINKILTANRMSNPHNLKRVEARMKKASLTELKKEYEIIAPFLGMTNQTIVEDQKIIPFMANVNGSSGKTEFTASTSAAEFNSISTQDLLEGKI